VDASIILLDPVQGPIKHPSVSFPFHSFRSIVAARSLQRTKPHMQVDLLLSVVEGLVHGARLAPLGSAMASPEAVHPLPGIGVSSLPPGSNRWGAPSSFTTVWVHTPPPPACAYFTTVLSPQKPSSTRHNGSQPRARSRWVSGSPRLRFPFRPFQAPPFRKGNLGRVRPWTCHWTSIALRQGVAQQRRARCAGMESTWCPGNRTRSTRRCWRSCCSVRRTGACVPGSRCPGGAAWKNHTWEHAAMRRNDVDVLRRGSRPPP